MYTYMGPPVNVCVCVSGLCSGAQDGVLVQSTMQQMGNHLVLQTVHEDILRMCRCSESVDVKHLGEEDMAYTYVRSPNKKEAIDPIGLQSMGVELAQATQTRKLWINFRCTFVSTMSYKVLLTLIDMKGTVH